MKLNKHIVDNTMKTYYATIISDNLRGFKQAKKMIKEEIEYGSIKTIDQQRNIFCYFDNEDGLYIFNKNKALHEIHNKYAYNCFLLKKNFYYLETPVDPEKKENFGCIYDSKTKITKYFPVQYILNEIIWYKGKLHYIISTYTELIVISFDDNKKVISFDTTQYGVVYQVISGPNNWLISLTYGKDYICIFGIDEQRLIKAFSFEWSSYRLLYYERLLFLYNTKDVMISLNYYYYYK